MKRQLVFVASVLCFTICAAQNGKAQWVSTNGPTTKPVTCLYGGIITLAGCQDGIYSGSSNSWTSMNGTLTNPGVVTVTYDLNRSNVFIGTDRGKVYASFNGGDWMDISTNSGIVKIFSLAVNDTNVYVGTDGTFWHSGDLGTKWKSLSPPVSQGTVTSMVVSGQSLLAVCQNAVYISPDNGSTWTPANTGLPTHVLMLALGIDPEIFAGTDNGVYATSNNGTTWLPINQGITGKSVTSVTTDGTNIYAGTQTEGVFFSRNNGAAWQAANTDLPTMKINAMAVNFQQEVLAATDANGVWKRSILDFIFNSVNDPKQSNLNISLSPNPSSGLITVHSAQDNILNVSVRNILDETVLDITKPNSPEFTLDLSRFPSGIYVAAFTSSTSVITKKIVRE